MSITCGIDWAEAHHDVALVDSDGTALVKKRIDTGLGGFTELLALIAEHSDTTDVPVAIETDKNLLVAGLQAAGFTVYAINPRAVAATASAVPRPGGSRIPATPSCWPTSCAPTATCTAPCRSSASSAWP